MGTWNALRVSSAASEVRADALDFADDRDSESSSVWIALGHYQSARGQLAATEVSAALLRELENLGLRSVAGYPRAGILEYRRR
jgi:hypothetical protein